MASEQLATAARHFFQRVLPAATGKQLTELVNPEVLVGAYRGHSGGAVQAHGGSVTPRFTLKVAPTAARLEGGLPVLGDLAPGSDARDQPLVWLRLLADAKVDEQAVIADLIGDLDTYAERRLTVAGVEIALPEGEPTAPGAAAWAAAIAAHRGALPDDLNTLQEVPEGLRQVAPAVDDLRIILGHFFTYDQGVYYPKWSGAGRQVPGDLAPGYLAKNLREVLLQRDQLYLYMLAPKSLFTTEAAEAHDYRELIFRFEDTGDATNPYLPILVHSVYRRIETAHPFHDFIFFESEDGVGLAVPEAARSALSPAVTQLLSALPEAAEDRALYFEESPYALGGASPMVQLLATVDGDPAWPEGVLTADLGTGPVRSLLAPPDRVLEIAALDAVTYLDVDGNPERPMLDQALAAVAYDGLRTKYPAADQDGADVIVGVIDTGIDGNHPAFNDAAGSSRILAVWQQDEGATGNASSPAAQHPGNAAYSMFNYGREYTGAAVSSASDANGHGTHVAGIAAGASVTAAGGAVPRGLAPKAKIVAVRTIGVFNGNVNHAVRYIFQKADEQGLPCVINMSFGHHDHAHDGTDARARFFSNLLRDAAGDYVPGRVLVASAGNDRGDDLHVRRTVTRGGWTFLRHRVNHANSATARADLVSMWVRNTGGNTKPRLWVWVQHVPTGWSSQVVTHTSAPLSQQVSGQNLRINVEYQNADVHNGDYNVRVLFRRNTGTAAVPREEWRIFVVSLSDDIELHAWSAAHIGRFLDAQASDDAVLVGAPGTALDVVTVASSNSRLNWQDVDGTTQSFGQTRLGDLSSFSSPGPLRIASSRLLRIFGLSIDLTHPAIDVTAPGSALIAAKSDSLNMTLPAVRRLATSSNARALQGTSMATPVITGLIANLLAGEPALTQAQARARVRAAGRMPAPAATQFDAGSPDPDDWGTGLVHGPSLKP